MIYISSICFLFVVFFRVIGVIFEFSDLVILGFEYIWSSVA